MVDNLFSMIHSAFNSLVILFQTHFGVPNEFTSIVGALNLPGTEIKGVHGLSGKPKSGLTKPHSTSKPYGENAKTAHEWIKKVYQKIHSNIFSTPNM